MSAKAFIVIAAISPSSSESTHSPTYAMHVQPNESSRLGMHRAINNAAAKFFAHSIINGYAAALIAPPPPPPCKLRLLTSLAKLVSFAVPTPYSRTKNSAQPLPLFLAKCRPTMV